ncbi:MAG: methionyl-tRNA formyltransferase [Burkholderiales bacterium]
MKIAFAGTPEFAAQALEHLQHAGFELGLVLTQPDRPAGRGMHTGISAVKQLALKHGLKLMQPPTLKDAAVVAEIKCRAPDVMVVAAYGLILPKTVLSLPRLGCLNIHASLLPRWRGAAPIQRALLAGDAETGISIMQMDSGLDTGPVLLQERLNIATDETAQTLHDKLARLGGECIVRVLQALESGALRSQPQTEQGATYAAKLDKGEAEIDWNKPASQIERAVRAFNPVPGASTRFNGEMLKIWKARFVESMQGAPGEIVKADVEGIMVACGGGGLRIEELQKAGGRRLTAQAFMAGFAVRTGTRLGA